MISQDKQRVEQRFAQIILGKQECQCRPLLTLLATAACDRPGCKDALDFDLTGQADSRAPSARSRCRASTSAF